jgi:hypothetical protein
MKLSKEEYDFLYKKLEYRFKNSGNELVEKIKDHKDLSKDDIILLLKRLEYTFRKSEHDIIKKLSNLIGIENYAPIKYSNLKAKIKRDNKNIKEHIICDFEKFCNK